MSKRAAIAALAASVSLVGAGWLAAASLAGKAAGAADAPDPGSVLFSDATGEDPQAPDIHRVRVSNSARDDLTVEIELTNRATLDKNLRVDVYLDTDRDDATGRPSDGADFALTVIGDLYPAANFVALSQWSDGAWHEVTSTIDANYRTTAPFGPVIRVPRADIASTAGFEFVAVAQDISTTASDRAPDAGEWVYPFTFPATTSSSTTSTTETTSTDGSTSTPTTTAPTTTPTTTPTETTTPSPPPTSTTTTTVVAPAVTTTVQQTTTVGGQTTTVQQTTTVATTRAGQSTTTPAAPIDRCPNIRGAQPKVPPGMVKANGKCIAPLALTASGLVARPVQPAAGQQFAVGATILNQKTKKGLPSAVVSCPAVVGGKAVAARRKFFDVQHSAAYCYWMIPASARGAVLQVAVVATYQGAHVRRWLRRLVG